MVVFVVIGVLTHDASATAFVRDVLCFLGGWFAVAFAVRLYVRGGWVRVAITWLVGVSAAVFVRALIVGHRPGAFYAVALGFTGLLVVVTRVVRR